MKILQVLPSLESGGVERGTLEIAEALVNAGHDSWVLSGGGRLVASLENSGSHHICWDIGRKKPTTLLQVRKLRQWLHDQQFDIVHVRSRMPAWIVWLAWRKMPPLNRPHLVSTMHGLHSVNFYSSIMTRSECVIAVSKTCRRYILENYPDTKPDRIRLIYRGIAAEDFPRGYKPSNSWLNEWYKKHPETMNKKLITLPGRLTRLKGHLELLEVFAGIARQHPELHLLIVGGEDPKRIGYATEVRQRANQADLCSNVTLTGHRSDMRDIYGISIAVLALSTKPESFGRTALEPLSMGVPVVGFDHGGVSEILKVLFPTGAVTVGDYTTVANTLIRISMGDAAAVQENTQFRLDQMQAQTLAVYQELISSC